MEAWEGTLLTGAMMAGSSDHGADGTWCSAAPMGVKHTRAHDSTMQANPSCNSVCSHFG